MFGKFINGFSGFFRSILYIVGFEKRLESGDVKKFYAYQRMSFVLLGFALWILIFSGVILFVNSSPDSSINQTFIGSVRDLHIIGSLLILLLMLYHIVITLRRFDKLAFTCMFIDGQLPLWYVKKNHKLWYKEIIEMEKQS
jgi:cytochrome b subunit of formate dehydrogenase